MILLLKETSRVAGLRVRGGGKTTRGKGARADLLRSRFLSIYETEGLRMGSGSSDVDPLEGLAILIAANAFSRTIAKQGNVSHQPFWSPTSLDATEISTFVDNVLSDTLGVFTAIARNLPHMHDRIEKRIRESAKRAGNEFGSTAWQVAAGANAFLNPDSKGFTKFQNYLKERVSKGVSTFLPLSSAPGTPRDIGKNEKARLFMLPSLRSAFRLTNALQETLGDVKYAIDCVHCTEQDHISEKYFAGRASDPEIVLYAMHSRERTVLHNTENLLIHAVSQVPPFGRKRAFA